MLRPSGPRAFLAAATLVCALAAATPSANALVISTPIKLGSTSLVNLNLTIGPTQPLANPLCGLIGQPEVNTLLCALNAAQVQWVTKFKRPDGTLITRSTVGPLLTPLPINVDDDILPDIVATPLAFSLTQFQLRVDRFLGETGTLPLSVEAVILDPTGGAIPRDHIHGGYDARDGRAPQSWQADITLSDVPGGERIVTTAKTTPFVPGDPLTLTGGIHNGDGLNPSDPMGGRLHFAQIPATTTLDLGLGDDTTVGLDTSSSTTVDGDVDIVKGAHAQHLTVHGEGIPSSLDVTVHPGATDDQRTITYTASSTLAKLDFASRTFEGATQTSGSVVHATGIPTSVIVEQTAAKAGSVTTNGSIDTAEAGFASGEPQLANVNGPYVKVLNNAQQLNSFAVRVDGLKHATFDATDVITADAEITPQGRKPLRLLIDTPADEDSASLHLDGIVDKLPEHLTFSADLDAVTIHYDGHGQGIDKITAHADSDEPFFERATHLEATAENVPALETLTLTQISTIFRTGVEITASQPLGTVTFAGSDGAIESPSGTGAGALLRDTATKYRVAARAFGLEQVRIEKRASGILTLEATQDTGPFHVVFEDDDRTVTADVLDLPAHLTADILAPRVGHPGFVQLDGSSGIGEVSAHISPKVPFFDRPGTDADPDRLDLRVLGIPAHLTADVDVTDTGASFTLDHPLTRVVGRLTSGPSSSLGLNDAIDGVLVEDTLDTFLAYGSLANVTHLAYSSGPEPANTGQSSPLHVEVTTAAPTPHFAVHTVLDLVDGLPAGTLDATVTDLPSQITLDRDLNGDFHWAANAKTTEVTITGRQLPPHGPGSGGLRSVDALIRGIPHAFSIHAGGTDTGVTSDTPGESFDRIFVQASDGDAPDPARSGDPEGATNGASYIAHNSGGSDYVGWLRLLDVDHALFQPSVAGNDKRQQVDLGFNPGIAHPAAMNLHAETAGEHFLRMDVEIPVPTHNLLLNLNSDGETRLSYDTQHEDLGSLRLRPYVDDALGGDLKITGLPPKLTFCVASPDDPDGTAGGCDRQMKFTFSEFNEDNPVHVPAAVFTFLDTDETVDERQVGIDGVLCLKPSTTDADHPNRPPGPHYTPDCQINDDGTYSSNSFNKIEFWDIQVSRFRFELLSGHSIERDPDDPDEPLEDDLLAMRLNTPSFTGKASFSSNDIDALDELDTTTSLDAHGPNPLFANDYRLYTDTNEGGQTPLYFYLYGEIDCSDTALNLFDSSAPVEFFTLYPQVCGDHFP